MKKLILCLVAVAVIVFGVLFATGTIKLGKGNEGETSTDTNKNPYEAVIEEYKKAIADSKVSDTGYKYVNANAINHYYSDKKSVDFKYALYDINKDGQKEMLINNGIIDIFSYDGTKINRLLKDNADCLAETRCSVDLYDDGTIYLTGSGGATLKYIAFYTINKNSGLDTKNGYYVQYDKNGKETIYDEKDYDIEKNTGKKTSYTSIKELETANIKNTTKVDLSKLTWVTLK